MINSWNIQKTGEGIPIPLTFEQNFFTLCTVPVYHSIFLTLLINKLYL